MKMICFVDLNVWFVDYLPDTTGHDLVKEAMIADGYWDDCEMTDELLLKGFETHYIVSDEAGRLLEKAYRKKVPFHTEAEVWAGYETMKAVAEQFALFC